jgi:hypothetical protein
MCVSECIRDTDQTNIIIYNARSFAPLRAIYHSSSTQIYINNAKKNMRLFSDYFNLSTKLIFVAQSSDQKFSWSFIRAKHMFIDQLID